MRALWLVNQLWFIVPVSPWKFRVSSELLYKSNRPQVFYGLEGDKPLGMLEEHSKNYEFFSFFSNIPRCLSAYKP